MTVSRYNVIQYLSKCILFFRINSINFNDTTGQILFLWFYIIARHTITLLNVQAEFYGQCSKATKTYKALLFVKQALLNDILFLYFPRVSIPSS